MMSEPVLIAIIGAAGVVIAAIIGIFAAKAKSGNKTVIKQNNKGEEQTTQVGIVNLNVEDSKENAKKA